MDISSKIICENTLIILLFCAGKSVISRPSFARDAATANRNSLKVSLDINNEMSSSILEHFSLYFSNSRLMSSILNQLIRSEANFVDWANAPTKSLRVDFTIEGDDEEDDGDNDGEVDKRLDNFEEELVTVCLSDNHNNQPAMGAMKMGGGWQEGIDEATTRPQRWVMTKN